jgi:hypothetical protein
MFDDSYGGTPAYMASPEGVMDEVEYTPPQTSQKHGMSREAVTEAGVVVRQFSDGTLLVLDDPSGKIEDGTLLSDAKDPRWIRATMDIGTWQSFMGGGGPPKRTPKGPPGSSDTAPRGADATPSVVPPEPAATKTDFSKVGWFLAGVAAAALVNEFTKRSS